MIAVGPSLIVVGLCFIAAWYVINRTGKPAVDESIESSFARIYPKVRRAFAGEQRSVTQSMLLGLFVDSMLRSGFSSEKIREIMLQTLEIRDRRLASEKKAA